MNREPILIILAVSLLASMVNAQSPSRRGTTPSIAAPSSSKPPTTVWTTETWTGEERPYRQIRENLDAFLTKGGLTVALIRDYQRQAESHRSDPLALFRWAYAGYGLKRSQPALRSQIPLPGGYAFQLTPSPRTYEFARVRFLIEAQSPERTLKQLGERLLKRQPQDYEVKYQFMQVLDPAHSAADREQALRYAGELVAQDPDRADSYAAQAGVYYRLWWKSRDTTNAEKAISGYQEYLRRASVDAPFRRSAERIISYIKEKTPALAKSP